jgi:hypothetical protein
MPTASWPRRRPPAADAETARAELVELHRIEAGRTPAQVARAGRRA